MRKLLPLLMVLAVVAGAIAALRAEYTPATSQPFADERTDGTYITIVDESGSVLHMTGHMIVPGDEWVTHDNKRYEVSRVEGDIAFARFMGNYNLSQATPWSGLGHLFGRSPATPAEAPTTTNPEIAIYHTHSDESYVPTDGASSKPGRGGIYQVGQALKEALLKKGVRAAHDLTTHEPHDASAYQRSRRTAMSLLRTRPAAMFDVHRDAAPAQAYAKQVAGQPVTQVVVVVGKANPKWRANAAFANALKSEVDKASPGLIKGIMFRNGGYNQDLYDRLLLLEVGAHTNDRKEAERAMGLISAGVARLAGRAGAISPGTRTESRGSWSALGWIIGATVLGVVIYMFVSTGSFREAMEKLRRFSREDLAGFLGWSKPEKTCAPKPEGESVKPPQDMQSERSMSAKSYPGDLPGTRRAKEPDDTEKR